jgi:hypothetical protein
MTRRGRAPVEMHPREQQAQESSSERLSKLARTRFVRFRARTRRVTGGRRRISAGRWGWSGNTQHIVHSNRLGRRLSSRTKARSFFDGNHRDNRDIAASSKEDEDTQAIRPVRPTLSSSGTHSEISAQRPDFDLEFLHILGRDPRHLLRTGNDKRGNGLVIRDADAVEIGADDRIAH